MRLTLFAAIAALAVTPLVAQPAPPPKLLLVIAVDQFSSDLWDQYRPHFTGGFARLARGTVFRNGYQSHAASETCPGHSTILTGARPSRNGIIANNWIDQSVSREDQGIYCAEDERVAGSSSSNYTVSPVHLLVPTLGERLKQAWPGSRNVAISGKDRAAVMMSGHQVDQRWYWAGGKFVTDLKAAADPQAVTKVNAAIAAALAEPRPPLDPPALCQAKAKPVAIENSDKIVGAGRFARNAEDQNALRASPEFDGVTLALAAALVDEMQLGRKADPDVLAIGLSATDYVGHTYGTEGAEMCLQLLSLDRELGDFLSVLDSRGIDYAVALTADHGGQDVPERQRLAGVAGAARIDPDLNAGEIGLRIVNRLGLPGFGLLGENFGDVYVDRSLAEPDRKRMIAEAVTALRAHAQVDSVFTADELAATPSPTTPPDQWTAIQRVRASFYPGRSGDLVFVIKRDITPISDTSGRSVATHGSPWDYDRRVPILFWRRAMSASDRTEAIEAVDIMPTLAAMVGLAVDSASIDGKCLTGIQGIACPPR